jgi:hypothetical protein
MNKVIVTVEKGSDDNYWCYAEIGDNGFTGCGETVAAAKDDLAISIKEAKEAGEKTYERLSECFDSIKKKDIMAASF